MYAVVIIIIQNRYWYWKLCAHNLHDYYWPFLYLLSSKSKLILSKTYYMSCIQNTKPSSFKFVLPELLIKTLSFHSFVLLSLLLLFFIILLWGDRGKLMFAPRGSALLRCVRLTPTKTTNSIAHSMDPLWDSAFVILQGGAICTSSCGRLSVLNLQWVHITCFLLFC